MELAGFAAVEMEPSARRVQALVLCVHADNTCNQTLLVVQNEFPGRAIRCCRLSQLIAPGS